MSNDAQTGEVFDLKFRQLADMQKTIVAKVDGITSKLVDPPDGLFIQTNKLNTVTDELDEKIDDITTDLNKLVSVCMNQTNRTTLIETWQADHEIRDNELRESVKLIAGSISPLAKDYDRRMGVKKWTDKIIWTMLALLLAGVIPMLKAVFFDRDGTEPARLERIEKLLKKDQMLHMHNDGTMHIHESKKEVSKSKK